MDFWGLFWQVLAYGGLLFLVVVLVLAIIEPGPLQKPRTFGRRARATDKKNAAAQDEEHLP